MNRRKLLASGVVTAVAAATTAMDRGAQVFDQKKEDAAAHLKSLEERFDKLEHHHKNLVRVGGIALALSTGVDILAFF